MQIFPQKMKCRYDMWQHCEFVIDVISFPVCWPVLLTCAKLVKRMHWIQESKSIHLLNEIKDFLVVHELNVTPLNFFFCVFFLLHLKYMLFMVHVLVRAKLVEPKRC
jgi:hypothetical protein